MSPDADALAEAAAGARPGRHPTGQVLHRRLPVIQALRTSIGVGAGGPVTRARWAPGPSSIGSAPTPAGRPAITTRSPLIHMRCTRTWLPIVLNSSAVHVSGG